VHALVTGCAGFIGSQLTEALLVRGNTVRGIDALTDYYDPERKRKNLREVETLDRFQFLHADLCEMDIVEVMHDVDVVFHLAGQPGVRVSWSDGFPTYVRQNILATQRLLEAARAVSLGRLVYASSSSVYGNAPEYPVAETEIPRPHSPYGVTKLAAEHLCSLYADNWGVPAVSLRYFTVYGPRQRPDMGFSRFFEAALAGRPLQIFGTGDQVRDFTYVGDVVNATLAAGAADIAPGFVCNVSGGSSISVKELVPMLSATIGREIAVEHAEAQPGDVQRTGGSTARARELLGWEPEVTLSEGLARQYEWLRSVD
jgi:nucleoside-diphosphate-sugar epimerase